MRASHAHVHRIPGTVVILAAAALFACAEPNPTEPASDEAGSVLSKQGPVGPPASVVFYSQRQGIPAKLWVMDPDGGAQTVLPSGPGNAIYPDISPDGRHVVFASNRTGDFEIWLLELATGALTNLSNQAGNDEWPRFSPNGQQIAFHGNVDGDFNLYVIHIDGTGLRRVTNDPALDQWADWSPNGKQLAFRRGMDIHVVDVEGEEQNVRRLTFLPATVDQMPAWSPNGKYIAFMSAREGYTSVFLMTADGDTPEHPAINLTPKDPADLNSAWVSRAPAWSMNGRHIYFMSRRPSTNGSIEIFVMNADGSGVSQLTDAPGEDGTPQTR
jgi:Tol biopolymer transport system component